MICEICKKDFESLDDHHIVSKSKGGSNKKTNKASICPNCHRLVHKGLIIIEGRFGSIPRGDVLVWRKHSQDSITGVDDPEVYIQGRK